MGPAQGVWLFPNSNLEEKQGYAGKLYITLLNCNDNGRFLQHEGLSNTHRKARERL